MASVAIEEEKTQRKQGFRRPILVRTFSYYITFILLGASMASVGPTLPGLAAQTATTISGVSLLLATRAMGRFGGTIIAGRLYDRVPGHPVIGAAMLAIAVMNLFTSFIPLLLVIAVTFFIIGLGEGLLDVGTNTLLLWTYREKSNMYLNGLHFFYGVGSFVMPVIVAQILVIGSNPDTGWFIAPFTHLGFDTPAPVVVWVYRLVALFFLPGAILLLTQKSLPLNHNQAPTHDEPQAENAVALMPTRVIVVFMMMFALYVGAEVSYAGWVYTYALKRNLADVKSAAYLVSLFWFMVTVGRFLVIGLSVRWTPRRILSTAFVLNVSGILLLIMFPQAIWLGTAIFALGMGPVFPTLLAFASRNFTVTAKSTSYFYIGANFSVIVFPWLIGQLFAPLGPQILLYVVALAMVLDSMIFVLLLRTVNAVRPQSSVPS